MMFFRKNESFSVIDIGKTFLKYGVISFDSHRPRVLEIKRVYLHRLRDADIAKAIELTLPVIFPARGLRGIMPPHVWISLGSPFILGKTMSLEVARSKPSDAVTQPEIQSLRESIKRKAVESREWRGGEGGSYIFLNPWIETAYLNGYPVTDPIGMKGEIFKLQAFLSVADAGPIMAVQRLLTRMGFRTFRFYASPLLLAKHLSQFLDAGTGVIIDIGGEATDIILCERGYVRDVLKVSYGGEELNKSIATATRLSPVEAEQFKRDGAAKILARDRQSQFETMAEAFVRQWSGAVLAALSQQASIDFSFTKIIISGGGASPVQFVEGFQKEIEGWGSFLLSQPSIHVLQPHEIAQVFDPQHMLLSPADTVLACLVKEL